MEKLWQHVTPWEKLRGCCDERIGSLVRTIRPSQVTILRPAILKSLSFLRTSDFLSFFHGSPRSRVDRWNGQTCLSQRRYPIVPYTFSPRWPSPVDSSYFLGAAVFGPSLFVVFLFSILSYFLGQWKGQTHLHCHMSLVKSLATSELTRSPQRYAKCTKYVWEEPLVQLL